MCDAFLSLQICPWRETWLKMNELALIGEMVNKWEDYTKQLVGSVLKLRKGED